MKRRPAKIAVWLSDQIVARQSISQHVFETDHVRWMLRRYSADFVIAECLQCSARTLVPKLKVPEGERPG